MYSKPTVLPLVPNGELYGLFDENVPRGYKQIRMKLRVKTDVPDERLEELVRLVPTFSPVFGAVTRAVNVEGGPDK